MKVKVTQCSPSDPLWPQIAEMFPRAIKWLDDPNDDGNYHFFAATDDDGAFVGGSVIDIGNLRFGPLSDMQIGFLEDIQVSTPHRRQGVGTALLRAVLNLAWECGAQNVRFTVDYDNTAGIALYKSMGFAFVPEEDPDSENPEKCYTVVTVNPKLGGAA